MKLLYIYALMKQNKYGYEQKNIYLYAFSCTYLIELLVGMRFFSPTLSSYCFESYIPRGNLFNVVQGYLTK